MAEQNGAQARAPSQPQYLSESQSYPSPQMQPSYAYPPPQGQPPDGYRQSPNASSASLPPVNLPPLRSIDSQQHPPPPQLMPQPGASQMHQPMPPMGGYYQHPPPGMPHAGPPLPAYARYAPIPQGGPLGGARGKKEIKRRTKTGCLTCRKRRIKCDELHPTCRNCQKSKRECLGYDPIFKQQTGPPQTLQPAPNPPNLQPAPSASPSSASPTPASSTSTAQTHQPPQPSYQPSQPTYPLFPSESSPRVAKHTPPAPQPHSNPPSREQHTAIDPALAEQSRTDSESLDPDNSHPAPAVKMESAMGKPASQTRVDELFQVDHYEPFDLPPSVDASLAEKTSEIRDAYLYNYASGLDRLLETQFYTTTGLDRLFNRPSMCAELHTLMTHFSSFDTRNGTEVERRCRATEARMVWHLLCLSKPDDRPAPQTGSVGAPPLDLEYPHGRLEVLECLLTNRILTDFKPVVWQESWSKEKTEELLFWSALAKFVSRRSDDPAAAGDIDKSILQCRNLLSGRENRDVIYSIMITRNSGWKVPGFPDRIQPEHGGEGSLVNKVFIAKQFLADEAAYKGTNSVVMRISGMAVRGWAIGWPS